MFVFLIVLFISFACPAATSHANEMQSPQTQQPLIAKEYLGIHAVDSGSPADKSGLMKGDRIISVNGKTVRSLEGFCELTSSARQWIALEIDRYGRREKKIIELSPEGSKLGVQIGLMYVVYIQPNGKTLWQVRKNNISISGAIESIQGLTVINLVVMNLSKRDISFESTSVTVTDGTNNPLEEIPPDLLLQKITNNAALEYSKSLQSMNSISNQMYTNQISSAINPKDWSYGFSNIFLKKKIAAQQAEAERTLTLAQNGINLVSQNSFKFGIIPSLSNSQGVLFYYPPRSLPLKLTAKIQGEEFILDFSVLTD